MGSRLIIHKFPGTSVGDTLRSGNVADIVIEHQMTSERAAFEDIVIVVSAMSGVTSDLADGAWAEAEGRDAVHRQVKARLLARHLDVVETLLTDSPNRLSAGRLVEDRLHELELLYRSIAVLGEVTVRDLDAVASFGEQPSVSILAAGSGSEACARGPSARPSSSSQMTTLARRHR